MERQEKKEDSKKDIYPKNNDNHPISKHKYKKPSANKKFIKNPHISYLNINSHFIYSENDFQLQLEKLKNKNLIKLTKNEEEYLRNLINEISIFHSLKNNEQFIEINANMYDKINNFKKIDTSSDQLAKYIKEKILSNNSRIGISCRKLAASYTKDTGNPVGKSTIQKIIRHKLGYRYLKTVKKSNYLASDSGVCSCLVFIKIVVKALIQGFQLIFVDESSIESNNTHYHCWRMTDEHIFFGNSKKEKINLIAAINKSSVIYYELNDSNTSSDIFLNFMKKLKQQIDSKIKSKYLIILDNFSGHKTPALLEYYQKEKINVIFNVPYCSYFNCIELLFRALKKYLYDSLYNTKNDLINDVNNFLENNKLENTLTLNYKETMMEYLHFVHKYKFKNVNNIN